MAPKGPISAYAMSSIKITTTFGDLFLSACARVEAPKAAKTLQNIIFLNIKFMLKRRVS